MDKRVAALIGLSILVVLAGCNGATGPQSPASTSPVPAENETDTSETVYNGVQLPNGTAATSITETEVLAGHQALLANQDYRIGINLTHGTAGRIVNTTTVIASNRSSQQLYLQSDLPGRTFEKYSTDTQSVSRTIIGNDTSISESGVDSFEAVHEREAQPGGLLTSILTSAEFAAVNTTTIDGQDAIVYNITDVSGTNSTRLPSEVEQFYGSLTIDDHGLIHEATLGTLGTQNGTVVAMYQEYRTLKYGDVEVEEPGWVQNQTQG